MDNFITVTICVMDIYCVSFYSHRNLKTAVQGKDNSTLYWFKVN